MRHNLKTMPTGGGGGGQSKKLLCDKVNKLKNPEQCFYKLSTHKTSI